VVTWVHGILQNQTVQYDNQTQLIIVLLLPAATLSTIVLLAVGGSATSDGFRTKGPTPNDIDIPT